MALVSSRPNYKTEFLADKSVAGGHRSEDFVVVEEFLNLLARAVRQFRTYPSTSPLCTQVIAVCHKVLASLERRDRLVFRITPTAVIVDDVGIGAGTIVEQELARRLHRAHVVSI